MSLGSNRCCLLPTNTNVIGPQGANGSYGSIGQIGTTGSTGSIGVTGATGLCYRGYKGPQGSIGDQGGLTGDTGPIGPVGAAGSTSAINKQFTFTTISDASYNSFTDLTTLTTLVDNNILLDDGSYAISYEINENWIDPNNSFYIVFNRVIPGVTFTGYVFDPIKSLYLILNTNNINLYGIGNDTINLNLLPPGTHLYEIQLWQSSNSGPILIPNKTVKFSITFVKIS